MQLVLFDDNFHLKLRPLTLMRPVADLRVGVFTIKEKWERLTNADIRFKSVAHLEEKFGAPDEGDKLFVQGNLIPDKTFSHTVTSLKPGEGLYVNGKKAVYRADDFDAQAHQEIKWEKYPSEVAEVQSPVDIFSLNGQAIQLDISLFFQNRNDKHEYTQVFGYHPIIVEPGAVIRATAINTENGPVFIGKDAEVMEGSVIRGPFALLDHGVVKMGAKIYGPTTIGPYSKVGGELNNVVMQAFSNKGHDGFLGNSVIGEWSNLGADTNNSNLKNNYSPVKMWDYALEDYADTGMLFCGLIMGDHSKCGINTMFNTGTVVGACANIYGGDFPPKFIPSFAWGGSGGFQEHKLSKAAETAAVVMERRGKKFDQTEQRLFEAVFEETKKYRASNL